MTQNSAPTSPTAPAEGAAESDRSLLAAELALGILPDAEAETTRARLSDPAFAADHLQWQERFAAMTLRQTPVMAPARARQRIREGLGHAQAPLSIDPTEQPSPWLRRLLWLALLGGIALLIWWVMNGQG